MARRLPTDEDRLEALRRLLSGLADGADVHELAASIAPLHPKNNTFPGEVFMGLATDTLDTASATRHEPIPYAGLREKPISPNVSSAAATTAKSNSPS